MVNVRAANTFIPPAKGNDLERAVHYLVMIMCDISYDGNGDHDDAKNNKGLHHKMYVPWVSEATR